MFGSVSTTADESWWIFAAAGLVSILFGVMALFWPGLSLSVFIWLFAIYAVVAGIVHLVGMFRAMGEHRTWWTYLVLGLIGIAAGLFALAYPLIPTVILLYVIAFWAILTGIGEIIGSFSTGHFLWLVTGLISIVFGFLLLGNPIVGALAYVMVIGVFAIVRGIFLIVQAFKAPSSPPATT
jgi:uncharacterized membrane protein HdeD (DUF308 family)